MTTLVVAELIERLEGWLDYRPMQEFCSGALKDLREAASSLAELERERDEARLDKNEWSRYHQQALFKEAQAVEALTAAEARERVLREALASAVSLIDAMMTNDPNEPVSDAGHTALDLWKHEAEKLRSLVSKS
jgi:hypothetical protein